MSEEDFANRQYKHPSEIIPILKKAGFRVAAACYPEKHYEAPSMEEDLHWLKHKVEQGADALISQLFFDNDAFYRFMDAADQKGITVPVHAGIMPITSAKMINTTINLSGASIPKALSDLIATYGRILRICERLELNMRQGRLMIWQNRGCIMCISIR